MSGNGYQIGIVDLTRGELGTEGTAETRMQEATCAAETLGVQVRRNMDFGDCRLSISFDQVKKLANVIRQYRPSVTIAPYGDEHHPDHDAARRLAKKAVFLAKLTKMKMDYETHTVGTVIYYMLHKKFDPSFVVDVTKSYDKKLKAIRAYQSQMELMLGVGGLLSSIELRDQFYGHSIGVKRGEPFFLDGPLKINDPVAFFR
jgi:bacillithiol biosynthesis deacetylase BshB1